MPFKNTAGGDHPAGRQHWVNHMLIDDDTLYLMGTTARASDEVGETQIQAPDPGLMAEAFSAGDFSPLADTGASEAAVMTKM